MYEVDFKDWDLTKLDRADTVSYLSSAYNIGSKQFFTNYSKGLQKLSDETLQRILRISIAISGDKTTGKFLRQFARRWQCEPAYIARFAEITEEEYLRVRDTLNAYGISPDNIAIAQAFGGVLTIEDTTPDLKVPRSQLVLLLAAIAWLGNVSTSELGDGHYGPHVWINEEFFHGYLRTPHTLPHYHRLLEAICSEQQYSRFLEAAQSIDGIINNPLLTGVL